MIKISVLLLLFTYSYCQDKFEYERFYKFNENVFKENLFIYNFAESYPIPFNNQISVSKNWLNYYSSTKQVVDSIRNYRKFIASLKGEIDFFYELTTDGLWGEYLFAVIQQEHSVTLLKLSAGSLEMREIDIIEFEDILPSLNKLDVKPRVFYNTVMDLEIAFLKLYYNGNYSIKITHTIGASSSFPEKIRKICDNEYKIITIFNDLEQKYFRH